MCDVVMYIILASSIQNGTDGISEVTKQQTTYFYNTNYGQNLCVVFCEICKFSVGMCTLLAYSMCASYWWLQRDNLFKLDLSLQ